MASDRQATVGGPFHRRHGLSGQDRIFVQGLPGPDGASLRCTRRRYNNAIGSTGHTVAFAILTHLEPGNARTTSDPDH